MVGPLIDQIVGTAFLLMFVLALTDERNQPPKANLAPLLIGLAMAAIGMSFGANAGYAINPARDWRRPQGARGAAGPRRRGVRRDGGGAADGGRRAGRGPGPPPVQER